MRTVLDAHTHAGAVRLARLPEVLIGRGIGPQTWGGPEAYNLACAVDVFLFLFFDPSSLRHFFLSPFLLVVSQIRSHSRHALLLPPHHGSYLAFSIARRLSPFFPRLTRVELVGDTAIALF